jgi:pilus assembly protein Flp/PilA
VTSGPTVDSLTDHPQQQEFTMIKFIQDEQGATAIEYGLIATLVGIAIIAAATALGTALDGAFNTAATAITP